ncbi:nucleic-acid-binding protein from transposon X-element [Trichonephila clavipes]|nr:nucleic-acid-binding protein from transposon X-element [Trichonephila clavipes]
MESGDRTLEMATGTTKTIKELILSIEFVQSDQQMCEYLTMKWQLARAAKSGIELLEEKLEISQNIPNFMSPEDIQAMTTGLEAFRKELSTVLGEITLIFCPVKNCPSHTNGTMNDSYVAESSSKINDNNSTEQNTNDINNIKEKAPEKIPSKNTKNDKDNSQNKKRTGQEDFQTPKKFARKIVEIPIEKEIYRSYPNTVNKNTGNYIKIQPATAEDEDKIKKLLIIKKADYYTIEHPTVIKAVIKGLPSSTNVTDIESELQAKGFEVEKIAQLRKFSTKSSLPLFMIQIKRSENAQDIFKLKNLIYHTVEVVPFRRRPGASQCFNCNYFNHTSKNCKMTPRCLKCEGSHKTHDCPKTERLQALRCINCNENGHLASSRQCPRFPRLKLKQKSEEPKTINQTRPVTTELSYAKVCSNETEQQMAPRGETQNQTPNEKTPENNDTPNFLNFATYINELQNLTSKFPEIFQALEDMSKTNEIINLAHEIGGDGFNTFSHNGVDKLLVGDALSDNDIIDLTLDLTVDGVVGLEGDNDEEEKSTPLTGKLIQEGLQLCSKLENHFLINAPISERASKLQRELQNCMSGYPELYKKIKESSSQSLITDDIVRKGRATQNENEVCENPWPLPQISIAETVSSDDEGDLELLRKRCKPLSDSDND